MDEFCLPDNYLARREAHYFDDAPYIDSDIIHQPKVYDAADYFSCVAGKSKIIDIGCGIGRKLEGIKADRKVGIDFGINIKFCRSRYPTGVEWVEADLSNPECISLANHADDQSVVVCADVVEHLVDPKPLVALLAKCYRNGAIVLTSTPDRIRVRGEDHRGPPPNPSHVREWAKDEYEQFLLRHGLPAAFAGYTINNNQARELKTIVTLHDRAVSSHGAPDAQVVTILSDINEDDVVGDD